MKSRADEIVELMAQAHWGDARQTPMRADFSTRRFSRLERKKHEPYSAVLMDAGTEGTTAQFVAIANLLRAHDLSAPEIYAADTARGLAVMEDFGDRNVGRLIDGGAEPDLYYRNAVDALIHLHGAFDASKPAGFVLPLFDTARFVAQVELFLECYLPIAKQRAATPEETATFRDAWRRALGPVEALPRTLMLRDFMPDNIMDLKSRESWHTAGLLDFQDAGIGPIAYDLASLCEAVRRPHGPAILDFAVDYYHEIAAAHLDKEDLRRGCHVLAAQRHTRILGILARLAINSNQREKLAYTPRVWAYLEELLKDEALKPVAAWFAANGPFH
jgi:aminoglycoside/choline kinase family phosphotransferase